MKVKLLFPPQWTPVSPHYAMTSLSAQVKKAGYDIKVRDLNLEYYNKILNEKHLISSVAKFSAEYSGLMQTVQKAKNRYKDIHNFPPELKKAAKKLERIEIFRNNEFGDFKFLSENLSEAVKVIRSKDRFYNPVELVSALNMIDNALNIISIPYHPTVLSFGSMSTPDLKLTYKSILNHCLDKDTNMFLDYYEEVIPEIIEDNPELIAISINSTSQLVGGLTLAKILKERSNAFINIGGNYFGRVLESIKNRPEFFKTFAHGINFGEGELPIVEITKFVDGKISIEEVPNFVYLDEQNKVQINEECKPLTLNEIENQDLSDFQLDMYYAPEIVLPIQSSRGCYWQKCSFCDHFYGLSLNVKDVDLLISHIKELNSKWGIKYFEFVDESVHPEYLEKFSKRILEEGLEIYWFNNARTENGFTKERLDLAYKAGLRMQLWGVESGSDRVMRLINKGIDLENRFNILKTSKDAGIWNFAFIFFGFPSETWEEGEQTIKMICEKKDIIHSYGRSNFTLAKHTKIQQDPAHFSITKIKKDEEEFSPSYNFETSEGMNPDERKKIAKLCTKTYHETCSSPLWMYFGYREMLFLYLCKYGTDWVSKYNFEAGSAD